jgi:hypothetical protein
MRERGRRHSGNCHLGQRVPEGTSGSTRADAQATITKIKNIVFIGVSPDSQK